MVLPKTEMVKYTEATAVECFAFGHPLTYSWKKMCRFLGFFVAFFNWPKVELHLQ